MFASGKSMYGEMFAKKHGLHFIDSDLVYDEVLKTEGYINREDFSKKVGPAKYLFRENKLLAETDLSVQPVVIAPPGSIAYHQMDLVDENARFINIISKLKAQGFVFVYLDISLQELLSRNPDVAGRGVISPNEETSLLDGTSDFVPALYEERVPLYKSMADVVIPLVDGLSVEKTMEKIEETLSPILL
jgi:shikimate kinase